LIIRIRLLFSNQRQARPLRRAEKQGWTVGNADDSTDIAGSDPARRTVLAEATNALEAPW
jgi:hypothetical protein